MARILAFLAKPLRRRIGLPFVRRADAYRARSEWIEAVFHYRRGLEWMPWRHDLHVQIGNCLKEFGDYRGAVKAYRAATDASSRPEALKQLADANRRAGTGSLPYEIAEDAGDVAASAGGSSPLPEVTARMLPNRTRIDTTEPRRWLGPLGRERHRSVRARGNDYASILLNQVGAMSIERDGASEPLLTGVVAIRARIVAPAAIDAVEFYLGEGGAARRIATAPAQPVDTKAVRLRLHVVNAWIDCRDLPPGRHWLAIRAGSAVPPAGLFVNIASSDGLDRDLSSSDAFLPSVSAADGEPDRAIISAPAMARSAARTLFDRPIRSIVALRVDQLGDVSASLPAIVRLRALFPDAQLTVIVQSPVRAIVEASGLADHVLTLDLSYDHASETRHLSVGEEQRVRSLLAGERPDLAIDLCPGDETRPLLLLTGATYLAGFNADRFPFLDYGISVRTRDKVNQLDRLSHAASVLTLVEGLAVAIAPARPPVPRVAASDDVLAAHGLVQGGYVVLHTGARHEINRWPLKHFQALAARLATETGLRVVIFADRTEGPFAAEGQADRVQVLGTIDPEAFDAILSGARLMIGNDSGPKHLAATRGVPTVSVHVGRLNWNEWGQDGRGTILSKRVPCTGCGLNDIQLCGRDAICIRSITVDEVMAAARAYL
jgi:ADP-heptose:LPS heptosyltransferase